MELWLESIDRYNVALDGRPDAWLGGTWTVVSDPKSPETVLAAWSPRREQIGSIQPIEASEWVSDRLGEVAVDKGCAVIVGGAGWVGFFEPDSFHGSTRSTHERLADTAASVATLYWNEAIGHCELTRRVGSRFGVIQLDSDDDSADFGEMDLGSVPTNFRDALTGEWWPWAVGLAIIETWTGAVLPMSSTDPPGDVIVFDIDEPGQETESLAAPLDQAEEVTDKVLLAAVLAASGESRRRVGAEIAAQLVQIAGIGHLGGVAGALDDLRDGADFERSPELLGTNVGRL